MTAMKKSPKHAIDSVEKLAAIMLDSFSDIDARFDAVDARFDAVDARFEAIDARFDALENEMRTGFTDIKRTLDRIDTRLAALELAVFGASSSHGGRVSSTSILSRLAKLEKAVFKK